MKTNGDTQTLDGNVQTLEDGAEAGKIFPASRTELAQLGHVAREAVRDVKDRVSTYAGAAKRHLVNLAGHARKESVTHFGEVKAKAADLGGQTGAFVKQRPLLSLTIAGIAGVCVALILRRNKKKDID